VATINGTIGDDTLDGTFDADVINGLDGNDTISGDDGNDTIHGGDGNDTITDGAGGDTVFGDAGDDTILASTGTGSDIFDGGLDYDIIAYVNALAGVLVDLSASSNQAHSVGGGDAAGIGVDQLSNFEEVDGSGFDDVLTGNSGDNYLYGLGGNDELHGGAGDDFLSGGIGNNVIDGGDGFDIAGYSTSAIGVHVSLAIAGPQDTGLGSDTLVAIEELLGSPFDDQLTGSSGNDILVGRDGDDYLDGGLGADSMNGGVGDDTYVVDDPGDAVIDRLGGSDTIVSATSYTLPSNISGTEIENLTLTGQAAINGTGNELDNFLRGNANTNSLKGGVGNDVLDGGAGIDVLDGGLGNDAYLFHSSSEHTAAEITDSGGYYDNDCVVFAATSPDTLKLFAGDIGFETVVIGTLTGDALLPYDLSGTTALDVNGSAVVASALNIRGNDGANVISGGNVYGDIITAGGGDDTLIGYAGNDHLWGDDGADHLEGGADDDMLDGGAGADVLIGGAGQDTYFVDNVGDVIVEAAAAGGSWDEVDSSISWTLGSNLERLILTGSASINGTGNAADNLMGGNEGANVLRGLGGDDNIGGGLGDDTIFGGDRNDTLGGGDGYDRMYGGTGDDFFYVNDAADFAYENAGEGHDTVVSSIDLTLRANVEDLQLTGGAYIGKGNVLDNAITGTDLANKLYGYEGNDSLNGQDGDDYLFGADGNDTLIGAGGYDRMYGGIGDDRYYVNDTTDYAYENLGEGYDIVVSSLASYQLRANVEELDLAEGSVAFRGYGNELDNKVLGNSADNLLYGHEGNDWLEGNYGNDILYGENGNDTLLGGAGMDRFYGGGGKDKFVFRNGDFAGTTSSTADRIQDFSEADHDIIHLAGVDANLLVGGDQAFSFIGSAIFSHTAGELRAYQAAGQTWIQGDIDGDGVADFLIRIDGLHTLTASDFIL